MCAGYVWLRARDQCNTFCGHKFLAKFGFLASELLKIHVYVDDGFRMIVVSFSSAKKKKVQAD